MVVNRCLNNWLSSVPYAVVDLGLLLVTILLCCAGGAYLVRLLTILKVLFLDLIVMVVVALCVCRTGSMR